MQNLRTKEFAGLMVLTVFFEAASDRASSVNFRFFRCVTFDSCTTVKEIIVEAQLTIITMLVLSFLLLKFIEMLQATSIIAEKEVFHAFDPGSKNGLTDCFAHQL
jgi:hypothetical protein